MIRPAVQIVAVAALTLSLTASSGFARSKRAPDPDANTSDEADTGKATSSRSAKGKAKATSEDASADSGRGGSSKAGQGKGTEAKAKDSKGKDGKGKPVQVGSYGEWGAFTAQGKAKTCYALAKPKERVPATLKRDQAYVFISNRPGESVRNEVSIIMGFPMKDNSDARGEIDGATFDLICKGTNAWVKDQSKEPQFIEAMKRGSKLVIKASSVKGGTSTDSYSLAGLSDALARVQKDCP